MIMKSKFSTAGFIVALGFATVALQSNVAVAQGYGGYSGDGGNGLDITKTKPGKAAILTPRGPVSLKTVSPPATNAITSRIGAAADLCRQLDPAYYVDCLGERLDALADELSSSGDYAAARKIIDNAAGKLRSLAKKNKDTSKQRVRLQTKGQGKASVTKPISAIKPAASKAVRQEAEAIIAEAQTLLLRSASNSDKRKSHYQQIAAAVGSETKVLLRSL
jgi:hypothetical protein